jgi:hypothetical protein
MSTEEIWRACIGFEGLYEVSNLGRVRRVGKAARTGKGRGGGATIGKIKTGHVTQFGYVQVVLWADGKAEARQVHRLVAEAFHGRRPPGHEPNHKDGNKQNNFDTNLEWMTRSDNMRHAYANGLRERKAVAKSGEAHHNATLTDEQVAHIRARFKRGAGPALAREFSVNHATIYRIVKGKTRAGASA